MTQQKRSPGIGVEEVFFEIAEKEATSRLLVFGRGSYVETGTKMEIPASLLHEQAREFVTKLCWRTGFVRSSPPY
jgi:hypothetical protein